MNHLRPVSESDRDEIRGLYQQSFSGGEERVVARVATELLNERTSPETFALVAEIDRAIVGHIAFSPVTLEANQNWSGYILAPLGVKPEYQKRRIGSELVDSGLARLSEQGVDIVFVYGDPAYYGRFGFRSETAGGYLPPYELQYPFGWQAIALREENHGARPVKISCVASLADPALW